MTATKRKRGAPQTPNAGSRAWESHPEPVSRRPGFWIGLTVAGALLRIILLLTCGGRLYPSDHYDFVLWGIQATDQGPLNIYHEAPPIHKWRTWQNGQWVVADRDRGQMRCAYPPLSVYLFYVSGLAFRAVSAERLINTASSQLLFSVWGIAGDVLVAAGCAAVVGLYRRELARRITYAVALFAPPLWWDTAVWGQTDSVLLAPAIWMLYYMLRQRWLAAGLLWGLALGLKPQAILFAPVWAFAMLTSRPRIQIVLGAVAGAAVLFVAGLPFTLHGGWEWLRLSYWEIIFAVFSQYTTLKAFNFWYLDALLSDSLDATATWLGATKDTWGKILLLAGLGFSFVLMLWRVGRDKRALILWTALSLLLFVMLPTKVHERYLLLTLPFLGIAAALWPRFWPAFGLLLVVMMVQLTWPLWQQTSPGVWPQMKQQLVRDYASAEARADPTVRLPSLENLLVERQARYRQARARTLGLEWSATLFALLATVLTATACFAMTPAPETRPPQRRSPDDVHGRSVQT